MKTKIALLSLLGLLLCGSAPADVYSLDQLLELARSGNRGLQASRDAVEAARSGVTAPATTTRRSNTRAATPRPGQRAPIPATSRP